MQMRLLASVSFQRVPLPSLAISFLCPPLFSNDSRSTRFFYEIVNAESVWHFRRP